MSIPSFISCIAASEITLQEDSIRASIPQKSSISRFFDYANSNSNNNKTTVF